MLCVCYVSVLLKLFVLLALCALLVWLCVFCVWLCAVCLGCGVCVRVWLLACRYDCLFVFWIV